MKQQGYFVAGTDTGVGKTLVSCGLIAGFRKLGIVAGGMKPVQAGSNGDDVSNIAAVSGYSRDFRPVCSYWLKAPTAPNIAAEREGKSIEIEVIKADFTRCSELQALTIVEGTGGWFCPVNARETMADVARCLQLPVVLVVGLRLGCRNHTLLTAEAIVRTGLPLAGWIANTIDPQFADAADSIAFLQRRLHAPLLETLAHAPQQQQPTAVCLEQAARRLTH